MHIELEVLLKSADGRVDDDVARGLEAAPRHMLIVRGVDPAEMTVIDARLPHSQAGRTHPDFAVPCEHCAGVPRHLVSDPHSLGSDA